MSSRSHRGRPVIGMVSAIGVTALMLGAIAWSGVFNPRLAVGAQWTSAFVEPPDGTAVEIGVVNRGATEVWVEAVTWGGPPEDWPDGWNPAVKMVPDGAGRVVQVSDLEPFEPFALRGGTHRDLVLVADEPCTGAGIYSPIPDLNLQVRSSSGRTVTVTFSEGHRGPPPPPVC